MAAVAYKQRIRLLIELIIFARGDRTRGFTLPGHLSDLFRIHNIADVSDIVARRRRRRVTSLLCSLPSIPRTHVKQSWMEQQPQCSLSYKGVDRHKWYKLNRLRLFQLALQPGWTRCLNLWLQFISGPVTMHPPFG